MALDGKQLPERPLYPSPSAGDGKVIHSFKRSGKSQGKGSPKKMVQCSQCGFVFDKTTVDCSGGTQDGNGGYSEVTKTADDAVGVTDLVSDTFTDGTITRYPGVGNQEVRKNAGCPLCGTKNGLK